MEPFKFMKTSDIIVLCSTKNERIEQFQIEMIDSFVKIHQMKVICWLLKIIQHMIHTKDGKIM